MTTNNSNNQDKIELGYCYDIELIDKLNKFVNDSLKENIDRKNKLLSDVKRDKGKLQDIISKLLVFETNMCYDDNVFNPNYEDTEIKYRMKRLEEEKESISNQIESYTQELEHINVKIDEIYNLVNKSIDKEYQNQVVCCSESEKYKIDILRSQEFERKRIARDLHDTVVQNLTNLIHKAELTLKVMDFDPIRAKLELMSITKNTREIIDEIRNIIYDLRPMAFDDIGIDVIIERKLSEIREIGVLVKYEVEGEIGEVDQIVLLTLIRIVGEACNNTLKHGKANKIEVKLRYLENFIEIYIKDDGIGFNMKDDMNINYESKSGFGLSMMRERVYLLSGIITFTSKENEGTEIYVKVPKCFKEES